MITNSECIHDPRERPSLTEGQARYVSNVSRDMWLGGIQECLRLAREHLRGEYGGEINGWEDLERAVERL